MDRWQVHSGFEALDEVIQGLRLGDNVVWQVDSPEDYQWFARAFASAALADERQVVYVRFAPHPPVIEALDGVTVAAVDPSAGFDEFSRAVHHVIESRGPEVFYVFDNLSALVEPWTTDALLANFFQVTCPYLFESDTVAYFALARGRHSDRAVARIRDTTQLLVDVFRVEGQLYVHPLKVWDRYSPQMFLPHRVSGTSWAPVSYSGDAALVLTSARTHPLEPTTDAIAPWDNVYSKLIPYGGVAEDALARNPEALALKQELCRMVIGAHPEFSRLALRYITLNDLLQIRRRMIGSGRIGGKAAGMLLARRILMTRQDNDEVDFAAVLEDHDSFYVGSDVFFTFLVDNQLFRQRLQLTQDSELSWAEFEGIQERFLEGRFPPNVMAQFQSVLDYFGQAPIIVRSSSLLEDSFGNAFAGKYRSEFCANQGNPEQRLEALLRAVKLVYASAVNPNALAYRRKRGLGEGDEQMAVLIQRVSGMPHGRLFFPPLAGVAFSRNLYAWSDRIDPSQGMIRLVLGLGTRAVERVDTDYPRMIAVSQPELRPEVGVKVAQYSQRRADVLDLEANRFVTVPVTEAVGNCRNADLALFVSVVGDGYVQDPISSHQLADKGRLILTFSNLVRRTDFVPIMGHLLAKLEQAYGGPVDTEFTASVGAHGVRVNLLQCRPLRMPGAVEPALGDTVVPAGRTLFRSRRMIFGGVVRGIRYILYISPERYARIPDLETKRAIGRVVGRLNEHPAILEGRILMMGPGRWGSNNIDLGVNVSYGDIDNAAVLVEVAREEAGHLPELSYGTHFFQDLVEAEVIFLAVYPDDPEAEFNAPFFERAPNALGELLPQAGRYEEFVSLIDVPATAQGKRAHVIADSQERTAVCFVQ